MSNFIWFLHTISYTFLNKAFIDIFKKFFLNLVLFQNGKDIFWVVPSFEESWHELIEEGELLVSGIILEDSIDLFSE